MNERTKIEFPEDFFKKLRDSMKKGKTWESRLHDWIPLVISIVNIAILIRVSLILPYIRKADLEIRVEREIVLKQKGNIEILEIPVTIYNYGKTVMLNKYPEIVFINSGENKTEFSIQGVFQKGENLRIPERNRRELLINVSNRSLKPYMKINSFEELMGNTDIKIRTTIRDRVIVSIPVDFIESNVEIASRLHTESKW